MRQEGTTPVSLLYLKYNYNECIPVLALLQAGEAENAAASNTEPKVILHLRKISFI
jgi:hypothetical protein